MGIETLTVQKFLDEVERIKTELVETGESRISLDDIGDRRVSKNIIKEALMDVTYDENLLDFDSDSNEFVVTAENVELVADVADGADDEAEDELDTDDLIETEPDYDEEADEESDALPF